MYKFILIVSMFVSQSVFATYNGENDIWRWTKQLTEQTAHLQQTMNSYTRPNRNYWDSEHDKKEELKLLFDVNHFIASTTQFNVLIDPNRIDYTYFELPHAFQRVVDDLAKVDEQIKRLKDHHYVSHEFVRHFNLRALHRDADDIKDTLNHLGEVIGRIQRRHVVYEEAPAQVESTRPTAQVTITAVSLFKEHSRKPKYKVTGYIVGKVSKAVIIVQRTFSSTKKYNVAIDAQGGFVAYFRNYWNATSIRFEVQFSNGESSSQEIDVN